MESDQRVYEKLEEIVKSQHETHVLVTEIKGDSKVQSQVLQFHIEQLKEFKADYEKIIDRQDKSFQALTNRIEKIEKWQIRIVGLAAGAAAILTVFVQDLKEAIFR